MSAEQSSYQALRAHPGCLRLTAAAEALPAELERATKDKLGPTAFLERLLGIEVEATGARRDGAFPDLADNTRRVHVPRSYASPEEALAELRRDCRRDRTEGQAVKLILDVEKDTLTGLMTGWFSGLGVPVVVLRGYSSQSYTDRVRRLIDADGRPAHLIYAGDFDASGEDIAADDDGDVG